MTAAQHLKAGNVSDAVTAALAAVRDDPADRAARYALAEVLAIAGDLPRADKHLDFLATSGDPKEGLHALMLRQLIRAEMARREVFEQGRVPEFLTPPTPAVRAMLDALIRVREGKPAEASEYLAVAEATRPRVPGTADGVPFEDFRDLDDVTAPVFEILTGQGQYFWLPTEAAKSLTFHPPEVRTDLIWRRAKLAVKDGPEGEVFVPCLYPGSYADADDAVKLGRKSDYRGGNGVPVRGAGLREFWLGGPVTAILELKELKFD